MRNSPGIRSLITVVAFALLGAACGGSESGGDRLGEAAEPSGVAEFEIGDVEHIEGDLDYAQSPPVGGDHNPAWQNCGFYETSILDENAVHSLEHGVIWIAYGEDTSDEALTLLRSMADNETHLLVSQYDGLDAPFVLSTWGRQLGVDDIEDPAVDEFVAAFIRGGVSPEPGARCSGGIG